MISTKTRNIQEQLARYVRDGKEKKIQGTLPNRLEHYRRLVKNIVEAPLNTAFPITKEILGQKVWEDLMYDFFNHHNPQTPQIWKLPFEFYQYAKYQNIAKKLDKPFIIELLYFEWIEIEIHTMKDVEINFDPTIHDVFENNLVINPHHKLLNLSFPVHLKNISNFNQNGAWFVLVYRHPDTDKVHFLNLGILFAFVLEQIHAGRKLAEILLNAYKIFDIKDLKELKTNTIRFIEKLIQKKIIIGKEG